MRFETWWYNDAKNDGLWKIITVHMARKIWNATRPIPTPRKVRVPKFPSIRECLSALSVIPGKLTPREKAIVCSARMFIDSYIGRYFAGRKHGG